ncbi:MAG: hypothetical protein EXQ70_07820 [Solirubrobacterales bacterium]|nr:hypothetical protein [Solirubrobacterales bacterium]
MKKLQRRPSAGQAGLVVAMIALVVAVGGTAFGGGSKVPGSNGVKSSDIAAGAVGHLISGRSSSGCWM